MRTSEVIITRAAIGETWLGIPGIEVTPRGRVFVTWYTGGDKEPHPLNRIYLQLSDDGGRTFSPPLQMTWPHDGTRAYDPTLWLDPQGTLWLIYNEGNAVTAEHAIMARTCAQPDAADPVWSPPRRIGYPVPFSARMNKPTVLSSGEWLMPVTWSESDPHVWWTWENLQGVGISTDAGASWHLHGAVAAPAWALENMIMECRDGSLLMYIRTGAGVIWQSVSYDRGRTWSAGGPTAIANPGSRFYIRALAGGRWLLLNSPDPASRTAITAHLSEDEGRTWSQGLVLDPREEVSYPDAAQAADGAIYAVHDRERYGAGEVILSVFREDEILAGKAG